MRRRTVALLLALAIATPLLAQPAATAAPTTRYSRLYVFGDSYSDIGAGYIDGNGPTAVAYLGWLMGLQVIAARVKTGEIAFDPQTTLFFLAGGLNDGRRETATTLANLRQQLQILRELGARHVTIAQLPTKIPQFAAVGRRLNPAYEQFVREEAAAGFDLWLNHWGAAFDAVMDHPAAHGIVDTTGACAGRAIFDQDATPVGDPSTFFFYHEGHPSTAVHRVVGEALYEEIAGRSRAPR